MREHTPGRLATMRRHPDPETAASLIQIVTEGASANYTDGDICNFYCAEYGSENEANANRIVACWNACEGIADPSAIPDLLAALIELASGHSMAGEEMARKAIAKATGGDQ